MAIPVFQQIMLPLLQLLEDKQEHSLRQAIDSLTNQFNLTQEEQHELLLGKEPVINLFAQLNQQSYSHAFALGQRSPSDLVLTGKDLVKLREDLVEERKPLLSELQDIPGVTIRTVTMIPIVASLWVPTDSRFALVRKALEMFGEKGTTLANKVQLFLERWWPAIPRLDNPVLHYKPVFVIHDFSKPPLADTLVPR